MNPVAPVTSARGDPPRSEPRVSLVIPAYREEENIRAALAIAARDVTVPYELIVVCDSEDDPTMAIARECGLQDARIRVVLNRFGRGRGLLNAIRTGIAEARANGVVITMADLTDDLSQIALMCDLHEQGYSIVAPSRHMRGGEKRGGPLLKSWLSRLGGLSLRFLTGLATSDPTNAFKLFDARFLKETEIQSTGGFEYSLELCAKAHLRGLRVVEIPTSWQERRAGTSKFDLGSWLPRYLGWYLWLVWRVWSRRVSRS